MFPIEPKDAKSNDQPDMINLYSMIESRIAELIHIDKECKKKLPKSYHQRLPRSMRRRAASHDTKRLPKKYRFHLGAVHGSKNRKPLLKKRRKKIFKKHKRILRKHARHVFSNKDKCSLHKWFAKRFKMNTKDSLDFIPIHNNTKNQRTLYRQTIYGCAFISMAHLVPLKLTLATSRDSIEFSTQLEKLNQLTKPGVGFSFCAQAIRSGRYEIIIHLFEPETKAKRIEVSRRYICSALVSLSSQQPKAKGSNRTTLTMWVPRKLRAEVEAHLAIIATKCGKPFTINISEPFHQTRIRLIGPRAREEAEKIYDDTTETLKPALEDADLRLGRSLGLHVGRLVKNSLSLRLVFYNKQTKTVDVILRHKPGRMLWHKLIKNKAHFVGGMRDFERLCYVDDETLIERLKRPTKIL